MLKDKIKNVNSVSENHVTVRKVYGVCEKDTYKRDYQSQETFLMIKDEFYFVNYICYST